MLTLAVIIILLVVSVEIVLSHISQLHLEYCYKFHVISVLLL